MKELASTLAESAHTEEGDRILGQMRTLFLLAGDELPSVCTPMPDGPRPIGIWEPEKCGAEYRFVRPAEPRERASLWANVGAIEPKGPRKRIVLIGESVARGFFFDPHFNPAMALQHVIREASGDQDLEVVDLGRTDLTVDGLLELAADAVQLAPDVIVVLAGNNWQPTVGLRLAQFGELSERLRNGGWSDVKKHLEEILRVRVQATIRSLCALAESHRFKLIFVLPEFNLLSWRTHAISPPLLHSTETENWHTLLAKAEAAISSGDMTQAEAIGLELIALDKGTTAAGFNYVAEAKLKTGAIAEARRSLEAARDSSICWPTGLESPRCFTSVQEVVRKEATKNPFFLIDLPRIFQGYLQGGLPDHRVFLDYCHFNVDGTHIAMAAVAQVALAALYRLRRSPDDLKNYKLNVDPRIEGQAHFLAAIHNANWGQCAELVRMHCDRALELAPSLHGMLSLFLDSHIRRLPSSLCQSFEELCQLGGKSVVSLLFDSAQPTAVSFLNPTLIRAVRDAVDSHQTQASSSCREIAEALLSDEHGVDGCEVNLLTAVYSYDSYLQPLNQSGRAYYRASGPISRFKLVSKKPDVLRLRLTCRQRSDSSQRPIVIRIGGRDVGEALLTQTWASFAFIIPSEVLSPGINILEIHWPVPTWNLEVWKEKVASDLEFARGAEVCPVYGDIHSLFAIALPDG